MIPLLSGFLFPSKAKERKEERGKAGDTRKEQAGRGRKMKRKEKKRKKEGKKRKERNRKRKRNDVNAEWSMVNGPALTIDH